MEHVVISFALFATFAAASMAAGIYLHGTAVERTQARAVWGKRIYIASFGSLATATLAMYSAMFLTTV